MGVIIVKKTKDVFENKKENTNEQTKKNRQKEIEQTIVDILLMSDFGDELLEQIGNVNDTETD